MNLRVLALLILSVVLCWSSHWHWAQTIDEPQHLWAGTRILQQFDFSRFDNSKMPVSVLNAAGWLWSQSPGVQGSWFWARAPQVLWLLGSVALVFLWSRRSHGEAKAFACAALIAFDPNLLAHAGVVTTDLPCTFGVLLACFTWSRLLENPGWKRALVAGAAVGFAQVTKFTALFLGPILALTTLLWCVFRRTTTPLRHIPLALLAGIFLLNLSYGFSGSFTAANQYRWKSETFRPLMHWNVPLPVPKPWMEGVDWVKHDDDAGQGHVYADGKKTFYGRPDHYLRTLPRKWSLPLLFFALCGVGTIMRKRASMGNSVSEWVPPLFLLLWFSVAFNSQVGNRYVLPVLPFFALWAARLPLRWLHIGVTWTLLSTLSWWPWGMSYFNETVVDRSQAWRIVADSDLDWGQADLAAKNWLSDHPEGLWNPDVPAPGPVLLSANRLTGVLGHPNRMKCYREHLPPHEHIAGALYPLNMEPKDFEPCFPWVQTNGDGGPLPAGEHVLIIRFLGQAALTIDGNTVRKEGNEETLLGVIVKAKNSFSAQWDIPQGAGVYLNGRLMDGDPAQ